MYIMASESTYNASRSGSQATGASTEPLQPQQTPHDDQDTEGEEELGSLFRRALSMWQTLEEGTAKDEQKTARECSQLMLRAHRKVERADLFSSNETVEDIQTRCLKYLLCQHYAVLALMKSSTEPRERLSKLQHAKSLLHAFLERCEQLELVTENERKLIHSNDDEEEGGQSLDANQLRQFKIQRYKEEKQAKETLKRLISDPDMEDEDNVDEELLRQRWITQISLAICKSTDELRLIEQELPILQYMEQRREEEGEEKMEHQRHQERVKARDAAVDPDRKGLEVTHIDPSLEPTREQLKADVFKFSHNLPTMSLDEYAAKETADAQAREAAAQDKQKDAVRRYKELEEEGLEDDEELVDQAVYRDRAWEDWKDEHAKGMGNTKRI